MKKRSQSVNVKHRKISFGDFQTETIGISVKKILIEVPFKKLCSVHQYKCTAQRFAVYACILGNKEHPDVDDVLKCVRKRIPSITRESVFRILMEFSDRGIIYRMDKIVNARFDGIARNHGHFICRECGAIQDFELPQDLPEPDNNPGFQADHVELRISGICAECAKKART